MNSDTQHISIIGDGGWGTALALLLAGKKYSVLMWSPFAEYTKVLSEKRENIKFLPGFTLPENISFTDSLDAAIQFSDIIVLTTPSQYMRSVVEKIKPLATTNKIFVNASKGLETSTLETMSDVVKTTLGNVNYVTLTGPAIAVEVAKGEPTAVIVASDNITLATKIQNIFSTTSFRVYTNEDVKGAELGASFKNVIAIAAGVCDGLGYGINTKSALLSRGIAEMTRLGIALGAKKETFYGLSGIGDLVTTCMSPKSRNRSFGEAIGKGEQASEYIAKSVMVVEGVPTAKAALALAQQNNIETPIISAVNSLINGAKPQEIFSLLMGRPLTTE